MEINLLDFSKVYKSGNYGVFNERIETNNNNIDRTNSFINMLEIEKRLMESNNFKEELRTLLRSRFNNDIDILAKCIGRPANEIRNFIDGTSEPPPGLIDEVKYSVSKKMDTGHGDNIQFGDKYVEIFNKGDHMINNYEGMMKGAQIEIIKKQKMEIAELRKVIKEQNALLLSRDEVIASQRETIDILKKHTD